MIGYFYLRGVLVEKNTKKGFDYFKRAIKDKTGMAYYNLAYCYIRGEGTPQDYDKAIEFYNISIEKGFKGANKNLNIMQKTDSFKNFATRNYSELLMKTRKLEIENEELKLRPPELGGTEYLKAFQRFKKNK